MYVCLYIYIRDSCFCDNSITFLFTYAKLDNFFPVGILLVLELAEIFATCISKCVTAEDGHSSIHYCRLHGTA